ncbi:MAG: hypothetical protein GF401_08925 [Chitinivibrionales bacterium]|nr:hypothetical protein [Chitinivibrionales bacterium]
MNFLREIDTLLKRIVAITKHEGGCMYRPCACSSLFLSAIVIFGLGGCEGKKESPQGMNEVMPDTTADSLWSYLEKANDPKNVALPKGAKPFDSGTMQPGEEYRHTFTTAGLYRYFCIPHEKAGMVGEVIVKEQ